MQSKYAQSMQLHTLKKLLIILFATIPQLASCEEVPFIIMSDKDIMNDRIKAAMGGIVGATAGIYLTDGETRSIGQFLSAPIITSTYTAPFVVPLKDQEEDTLIFTERGKISSVNTYNAQLRNIYAATTLGTYASYSIYWMFNAYRARI